MAMITPPRINSGTARMGVELAPEKVLFSSCIMEPLMTTIQVRLVNF